METLVAMGVFLPGLLAGAMMLVAWWGRGERRVPLAVAGLALSAAFIASFLMVEGWPGVPPHARWQWLLFMVPAAGAIGMACALAGRIGAWAAGPVCALVVLVMLQPPPIEVQPWLWKAIAGFGVLVLYAGLEPYSQRRRGFVLPLAMTIAFTAASIVVMEARFAKLALLAAAMAAAMGAIMLVAIVRPRLSLATSGTAAMAAAMTAIIVIGRLYDGAELPLAAFALVALSPLGVWCGAIPRIRCGWIRVMASIAAVVVIACVGVLIAVTASPEALPEYEYY